MPLVGLLGAPGGSLFFPQRASTDAVVVDEIFHFIFLISVIFFVLILGLMVVFVFKYRRREGEGPQPSASHSTSLEMVWTIIPTILVAVMFIWGFWGYMGMRQAPDDSYEIQVLAKKWAWSFVYPNGHIEPDLHVPVDRPIRLVMSSDDVIHSLYIPAFRLKMDVVPGRFTKTWFQATETGEHQLFCAEYCGTQHSTMLAKVVVHPSGEFEKWLEEAANFLKRMTPVEGGALLVQRRGCAQCHSVDGSAKVGPSFKGSFGTQQPVAGFRRDHHGGRELHPRVDHGADGQDPGRLQARDADLQGSAEGRGNRRDHRVHQESEIARQVCPAGPRRR